MSSDFGAPTIFEESADMRQKQAVKRFCGSPTAWPGHGREPRLTAFADFWIVPGSAGMGVRRLSGMCRTARGHMAPDLTASATGRTQIMRSE
jgi:hypothetical protein